MLSGTGAIWCGRVFHLGGPTPSVSLAEANPEAPVHLYLFRLIIGKYLGYSVDVTAFCGAGA